MTFAVVAKLIHICHLEIVYIYHVVFQEASLKHSMDKIILLAFILIFRAAQSRAVKFSADGGYLQPVIIEMMHLKLENVKGTNI